MKILIASDLYWPTVNGVATFSRNLARELARSGHEVLVIAPSQTGKRGRQDNDGCHIYRTSSVPFPFYQKFRISLTPQREVKRMIAEFKPDVIHIQMLMWIGQAAMRYGKKAGIPVVSTNHAMPENLMDNMRLLAPVARPISYMLKEYGARFHSRADYVTMPTQSAIDMFASSERMTVPLEAVSNGVDLAEFSTEPAPDSVYEKFNLPKDKPIIGYVGRVDGEKHLSVLMDAFHTLLDKTEAHLLIVGFGTEEERLAAQAEELMIADNVTLTGFVSDEDRNLLHRVSTVFAMPSPAELQSIATLEAMASGKPIVAVDAGALKELCQDGVNGYLCKKDDVAMIADRLQKIIDDPNLIKQFSSQSLKIAKTHDIRTTIARFNEIYEQLLRR